MPEINSYDKVSSDRLELIASLAIGVVFTIMTVFILGVHSLQIVF
jgi:uncharacterized membrane protein